MINIWKVMPENERQVFNGLYIDYLKRRNGPADFQKYTAEIREHYVDSVQSDQFRKANGEPLIDLGGFTKNQLANEVDTDLDERTLWAICTANVNMQERYAVDYAFQVKEFGPDDSFSWIMIEEHYHTLLLLGCVEAMGAVVKNVEPKLITALMVKSLSRLPRYASDPLILCTEIIALAVLRMLWTRGHELFSGEKEIMRRIDNAYAQIITDEIGHVRHVHSRMGQARLSFARALVLPIAKSYLNDLPQITALLGREAILAHVQGIVDDGIVILEDGRAHPLDVSTGHASASEADLQKVFSVAYSRASEIEESVEAETEELAV